MSDPRYASGTSLTRTNKEMQVDFFESMVGDFSDDLFAALKKLTRAELHELHNAVASRIQEIYAQYQHKPEEED